MKYIYCALLFVAYGFFGFFVGQFDAEWRMAKGTLKCEFSHENKVCWNPKETIEGVKDGK